MWPVVLLLAADLVVKQGQTLRITAAGDARSLRLGDRTVRFFAQPEGGSLALMPVAADDKPGPYRLEFLDAGGAILRSQPVKVLDARFPTQNLVISKTLSTLRPSPGEQESVNAFRTAVSDTRWWTEPFRLPVPGCMTSPFGVRRLHNRKPAGDYHAGLDQRGRAGTPVRAVTAGTVRLARMFDLRGGTVGVDHGQGVATIYLHLSKLAATEGAAVQAGEVIGYIGSTGRSTAPHLHWSLYVNGVPVNPRQWVAARPCR
jgi:murein DD-endopeptidase MepM/ murein hydrolase activator NlpD